jgi:hypothetical protein
MKRSGIAVRCSASSWRANGLRYLRVGGRRQNSESRILLGRRKSLKMAQNPTRQVHALLAIVSFLMCTWREVFNLLFLCLFYRAFHPLA